MKKIASILLIATLFIASSVTTAKAQVWPWGNGTFQGVTKTALAITLTLPTVSDNFTCDTLSLDTNVTMTVVAASGLRIGAILEIKFRNLVSTVGAHAEARTVTLTTGCQCAAVVGTASKLNIITLRWNGKTFDCVSMLLQSNCNESNYLETGSILRLPVLFASTRPYQN